MAKVGAPSKYRPEYCEMLIKHMTTGLSFESFAGTVDVCDDTLREWESRHPEFSAAKKRAFAKNRVFWEEAGTQGLFSGKDGPQLNATVWIFNMKNRFRKEWTDTHKVESKVEVTDKSKPMTPAELRALLQGDPALKDSE